MGMINSEATHAQLPIHRFDHFDSIDSEKFTENGQSIVKQRTLIEKDTTIQLSAGTLSTLLTTSEKATITNLKLIGTIDARDFKTMYDSMPLVEIDMSNVDVLAYSGTKGTLTIDTIYPANTIPFGAFGRSPIRKIIIPNSVTTIGDWAFWKSKLTNISLSNSLTRINSGAFSYCGYLDSITIPNSVTWIGDQAFTMSTLKYITIPNSVTFIGVEAFGSTGLKSIVIPNSVTSLGENAFYCPALLAVYANSPTPIIINDSIKVFYNKTTCILYVPAGSKILYQQANEWKDFVHIIEMAPNGLNELTDKEHFILYPNPITEGFYIDAVEVPATVSIHNQNGIELLSIQVTGKSYVDMTGIPSGLYFVKITTSEGILEKKLIKK